MKYLKLISVAFILIAPFIACKKEGTNKAVGNIEGTWEGKYSNGNSNPSIFYSLRFNAGGILEEVGSNGQVKGTGTWEIDKNIIEAEYTNTASGAKYSLIGAFYPSDGKLLGNWGFDESVTDGGLWEMTTKK